MANKGSKLSNIINKGNIVNAIVVLILFILIEFILPKIFPSIYTVKGQVIFYAVIIISILAGSALFYYLDDIKNYIKNIKRYDIKKGKKYKPYMYDDINEYPKVFLSKTASFYKYNSIIITDKFLDTSVDIVNIIKKYIPEANNKLLSNVLAYVKKYNNKLINRNKIGILPEEDRKPKKRYNSMNVKFENKDTVVFLSILHTTAYGITQQHHDYVQIYKIETNNNELLHEIKSLKLSPIFELYEVKYNTIEEVFDNLNMLNKDYKEWKEYVFEFFSEFDKLSYEKAKEFLKLTDYEIPEYWEDILLNKKYLKYLPKQ